MRRKANRLRRSKRPRNDILPKCDRNIAAKEWRDWAVQGALSSDSCSIRGSNPWSTGIGRTFNQHEQVDTSCILRKPNFAAGWELPNPVEAWKMVWVPLRLLKLMPRKWLTNICDYRKYLVTLHLVTTLSLEWFCITPLIVCICLTKIIFPKWMVLFTRCFASKCSIQIFVLVHANPCGQAGGGKELFCSHTESICALFELL